MLVLTWCCRLLDVDVGARLGKLGHRRRLDKFFRWAGCKLGFLMLSKLLVREWIDATTISVWNDVFRVVFLLIVALQTILFVQIVLYLLLLAFGGFIRGDNGSRWLLIKRDGSCKGSGGSRLAIFARDGLDRQAVIVEATVAVVRAFKAWNRLILLRFLGDHRLVVAVSRLLFFLLHFSLGLVQEFVVALSKVSRGIWGPRGFKVRCGSHYHLCVIVDIVLLGLDTKLALLCVVFLRVILLIFLIVIDQLKLIAFAGRVCPFLILCSCRSGGLGVIDLLFTFRFFLLLYSCLTAWVGFKLDDICGLVFLLVLLSIFLILDFNWWFWVLWLALLLLISHKLEICALLTNVFCTVVFPFCNAWRKSRCSYFLLPW